MEYVLKDSVRNRKRNLHNNLLCMLLFLCCCFHANSSSAQFDGKPIILKPTNQVIVQRCFIEVGGIKRTFSVAIGDPSSIHYAVDLSQGAIIKLWKGEFIDATTMWTDRGEEQLAKPIGENVITLPAQPNFALLQNKEQAWPDSITMKDKYKLKGYKLDKQGRPEFEYQFGGITILDKIIPADNNKNLIRTFKINGKNNQGQLWFRLAKGKSIKKIKKGSYNIVNENYRIDLVSDFKQQAIIRQIGDFMELIVPVVLNTNQKEVTYSIIW